jgi:hypothetical protein
MHAINLKLHYDPMIAGNVTLYVARMSNRRWVADGKGYQFPSNVNYVCIIGP